MSVSIKTVLDENIHRFTLPKASFEELERALFTIYGKNVFSIRYRDEDGDMISVSSTPELSEALRVANGKTLKLILARIDNGRELGGKKNDQAKVAADVELQYQLDAVRRELNELDVAQQELKVASEAARQAKAAAAQAFWEAEEAREKMQREAREKEEARLAKEQMELEREAARIAEEKRQSDAREAERLAQIAAEMEAEKIRAVELEAEKIKQQEAEAQRQVNDLLASEAAKAKRLKAERVQVFWDEDAARERADKEARAAEEARFANEQATREASLPNEESLVHGNVQCNVCNVFPIVGTRYQCTRCHDFDLCSKCEANPASHPIDHPLLKHKQLASSVTVHHGVTCDNCNKSPITGARFKCKLCPNFDLCEDCEGKDVHPADHPLFKFRMERVRPHGFRGFRMGGAGMGQNCGFRGSLTLGAFGPRVRRLQEALGIQVDGFFGPQTEEAVKKFQAKNGLVVDGVVGPQTRGKLGHSGSGPSELFDLFFHLPR